MKITPFLVLSGLVLASAIVPGLWAEKDEAIPQKVIASNMTEAEIESAMKAIYAEEVDLRQLEFPKAVEQLGEQLKPYGLQILFRPADTSIANKKVTLQTRGLSMSSNLSFLCRQVGYDWWADSGIIVVGVPEHE